MEKLQILMFEIAKWSDVTFGSGQRNPAILHHLKKEVPELIEAVENFQKGHSNIDPFEETEEYLELLKCVKAEYADCFMLLLDSAHHFGFSAGVLLRHTKEKLEINKKRKWGQPDENGVIEHIKEPKTNCGYPITDKLEF